MTTLPRGQYPTHRAPDSPPPLPFVPGEVSNGEFVPRPLDPTSAWIVHETLDRADRAASRVRMDRRRFLQTTGGMAAMLSAVNVVAAACAGTTGGASGPSPGSSVAPERDGTGATLGDVPGTTDTVPGVGGTYEVPPATDAAACEQALGSQGELIVDVHTHHVMPGGPWVRNAPTIAAMIRPLAPASCTEVDPFRCLDRQSFLYDLFLASDTTVAMLSDVPSSGPADSPVPFADQAGTRELAASLTAPGAPRVLVQSIVAPNFYERSQYQDQMSAQVATGAVASFKFYPAWGPRGQGFALDDPAIGLPAIDHARQLGVKVIAAHKGLPITGFDQRFNGPRDIVAAAAQFPDLQFVIYHSAFERDNVEGPYDPRRAARGTSAVVKAMDDIGLAPNSNVWCDLGTTWREVMANPTSAAHVLGKLLARVGERRVVWGTDAIWFGSPQPQIMAFRAFEITPEFQQRYGYPALTPEVKARVLGLNAAELLGLDVTAQRCAIDAGKLAQAKATVTAWQAEGAVEPRWPQRAPLTRREVLRWLRDRSATLAPF